MKGGSLEWIIRKFTREEVIKKLLNRPSYIAFHLLNIEVLLASPGGVEALMMEALTLGEEMVLVGFMPGDAQKGPQIIFPTIYILICFLQGFVNGWTKDVEALINY